MSSPMAAAWCQRLSAPDRIRSDPALLLRSFACLDLFILVMDPMLGSLLPLRSLHHLGPLLLATGISLDSSTLASAVGDLDFSSLPRSSSRPGLVLPMVSTSLGPAPLTRSLARTGPSALLGVDSCSGPTSLPQARACPEVFPLVSGLVRLDLVFPLPVVEANSLEPSPFLQATSQSGSPLSTLAHGHPESSLLSRSLCQGCSSSALGLVWLGLVSSLPVVDISLLGLPMAPRGSSKLGALLPALDFSHLGPSLSSRSFGMEFLMPTLGSAWLGVPLTVSDLASLDFTPFPKCPTHAGAPLLLLGSSRAGFVPPLLVPDLLHPEPLVSLQSPAYLGFMPSALDLLHLGPTPSPRKLGQLEPPPPLSGLARSDPVSSLLVAGCTLLGFPTLIRSPSYLEAPLLALNSASLGASLLARSSM